jgi:hypothetical protein
MSNRQLSNAVHRHYLETLSQRARAQPEPIQRVLEQKLARAMTEHRARLERTGNNAPYAPAANASPLTDLLGHIARQTSQDFKTDPTQGNEDLADLKSLRCFRDTWSKLSIDQSVAQALATGPSNAGPLNSHSLILQSLKLMRDAAPEYLNRFMTYADALLWLEEADSGSAVPKKNAGRSEGGKKRKSGRG